MIVGSIGGVLAESTKLSPCRGPYWLLSEDEAPRIKESVEAVLIRHPDDVGLFTLCKGFIYRDAREPVRWSVEAACSSTGTRCSMPPLELPSYRGVDLSDCLHRCNRELQDSGRMMYLGRVKNWNIQIARTYTLRSRLEKDKWSNRWYRPTFRLLPRDKNAAFAGIS
jgi:hypothetical protein